MQNQLLRLQQTLAPIFVLAVFALRRLACTRLSAERGNQNRRPHQWSNQKNNERRYQNALAAESPSSQTYSIRDGDRCQPGKPPGQTAHAPICASVQQLNMLVPTLACSRYGLVPESCREFAIRGGLRATRQLA